MILSSKRAGVVLISVIFLTVLIAMYVTSTFALSRGQLMSSKRNTDTVLAENAARSGLEYALARLEENAEWRGDGNGVIVDTPELTVVEDNGNVVGLISGAESSSAQFRIRFNFQDGAAGKDDLDDPSEAMKIDNPHVSRNNLTNISDVPLPLADGPGYSVDNSQTDHPVPAGAVALVCEGRVSPEFGSADANNPNPKVNRVVSTRVIEGLYRVNEILGELPVDPAVSMSKTTTVDLFDGDSTAPALLTISDATGEGQPKTRTRELFQVRNEDGSLGGIDGKDAKVLVKDPSTHLQAQLHPGVQGGSEDPNVAFYELAWDQIGEGSATTEDLKAGVYVFWEEDQKVHYYPKNFEQYMQDIKTNPADRGIENPTLPKGLTFVPAGDSGPDGETSSKNRFVVTEDLNVTPEGAADDLTIIPRSGAKETLDDAGPVGAGPGPAPTVNYQTKTNWPDTFTGNSSQKENTLVNEFMHKYFDLPQKPGTTVYINPGKPATTKQEVYARNFLLELAPTGEINGPNGAAIAWDQNGVKYTGDVKNMMDLFARGDASVNMSADQPNGQILQPGVQQQNGDPIKIYDYLQAGGSSITEISEIDLQGATDTLGAADFELTFAPSSENGLRISAPADVRVAADVRGQGASLKTKGEIRFTGVGFDLRAEQNEEGPAISLYSEDSITISTLRKDENSGKYEYTGLDFRGIIYAWKDVNLLTGHADETSGDPQKVRIQGAIVAYGGEPGVDKPGDGEGGDLQISGDQVELIFDPGYLVGLTGGTGLKARLGLLSTSDR
jgi:hypothetical protein